MRRVPLGAAADRVYARVRALCSGRRNSRGIPWDNGANICFVNVIIELILIFNRMFFVILFGGYIYAGRKVRLQLQREFEIAEGSSLVVRARERQRQGSWVMPR